MPAGAPDCRRLTAQTNGSMSQHMHGKSIKRAVDANGAMNVKNKMRTSAMQRANCVLAGVAPVKLLQHDQQQFAARSKTSRVVMSKALQHARARNVRIAAPQQCHLQLPARHLVAVEQAADGPHHRGVLQCGQTVQRTQNMRVALQLPLTCSQQASGYGLTLASCTPAQIMLAEVFKHARLTQSEHQMMRMGFAREWGGTASQQCS